MSSILIALCGLSAIMASPVAKFNENGGDWCIITWWPKSCSDNAADCLAAGYWDRFASEAMCIGDGYTGDDIDTDDDSKYCVSSWWPTLTCDTYGSGNCVGTELWENQSECDQTSGSSSSSVASEPASPTPSASQGFCHTSWWPEECELLSMGNCIGTEYPTNGYATYDDCMLSVDFTSSSPSPAASPDAATTGYCHTSWWPEECDTLDSNNCIGSEYPEGGYASYDDCILLDDEDDGVSPSPSPSTYEGWCTASWWPTYACIEVSSGQCSGWYPAGGWTSEQNCLDRTKSIAKANSKKLASGEQIF